MAAEPWRHRSSSRQREAEFGQSRCSGWWLTVTQHGTAERSPRGRQLPAGQPEPSALPTAPRFTLELRAVPRPRRGNRNPGPASALPSRTGDRTCCAAPALGVHPALLFIPLQSSVGSGRLALSSGLGDEGVGAVLVEGRGCSSPVSLSLWPCCRRVLSFVPGTGSCGPGMLTCSRACSLACL